jgi:hypothetical protein
MKSGNLNFLEPSGPLQACNRTALPYKKYLMLLSVVTPSPIKLHDADNNVDSFVNFKSSQSKIKG